MSTPTQPPPSTAPTPAQPEGPREVSGIDYRFLLSALFKYKWLIVAIAVVVTVGVAFWSIKLPKVYEATVSLEFDPNPARPLAHDVDDVSQPVSNYWMTQEWLMTQQTVIRSRRVCETVVRRLGLHRDPDFFDVPADARRGWRGVTVDAAASAIQGRITVVPLKDTRIVEISVRDSNPDRAMLLANAVADAYIEKTKQDRLGSTVSALEWLSTQLDGLKHELGNAELALHDFKREHNVLSLSLEDRLNITARGMERFSDSLTAARTKRIELDARLRSLRDANATDPMLVNSSVITQNGTVTGLRDQFREATSERDALGLQYAAAHPRIRAIDTKLGTIRGQMRRQIDSLLDAAELDLREARRIEGGLQGALDETNQDALQLNLAEIEYNRLNRERENKSKLYGLLLERTAETNLTRMLQIESVRILDRALRPGAPIKPNVKLNIGVGATTGVVLGLAFALLLAFLDRSVKNAEQVEAMGLTVLGIVPAIGTEDARNKYYGKRKKRQKPAAPDPAQVVNKDLIVFEQPTSSTAECCRAIRTNLTFTSADRPAKALVITSSNPQEGKTTVAISLAIVMAQLGRRVLLVDTDLRRPRIHRAFQVSSAKGVTSVLVGESSLEDAVIATQIPNLYVLPCGPIPPNPSELLHTDRFARLIDDTRKSFDQVIFDSPPIAAVTDAAIIAPQVDGALLVARMRKTQRDMLAGAARQLIDVGSGILGVVLNQVDMGQTDYGYKHYYYYRRQGYYSTETTAAGGDDAPRPSADA